MTGRFVSVGTWLCHRIGCVGCLAVIIVALASCKQGLGDRCQVDDDCRDGLVCNKATDTCQTIGGGGDIDATVPAELIDAPAAAIDAPSGDPK